MNSIKTVIFDLDDTLFDTWGQLVGPATREFCQAMVEAGLNTDVNSAINAKDALFKADPRRNYFAALVETFGKRSECFLSDEELEQVGRRAYLQRKVEDWITPFEATIPTLTYLRTRYQLFLVTSGSPDTQEQKIRFLGIHSYFANVFFVDSAKGETKQGAFASILAQSASSPQSVISVGDRVDREIKVANRMGMWSCHIQRGEFAHLQPSQDDEHPHYRIECISQLIGTWKL
ncbi:MAG: HAD family hydrolase [Acidobacteria bacterium]|nr:HAD family hydrolase [Acidobacteriota bacterium]MCB9398715.1 HAD family hydrolase [Acidobacteriota bacterium]